jgi:hypothetical protein
MSSYSDSQGDSFQNEDMSQMSLESCDVVNVTFVGEDDQPLDFNALPQDENSPEFNWAAAQELKKNLAVTFDKHIEESFGVKAKIQAFESKNKGRSKCEIKRQPWLPSSRPPTVPVNSSLKKSNGSNLSVFLRIRPPTASKEALHKQADAMDNTVEVLHDKEDGVTSRIRTYPPVYSNTSKVVRSIHQLHSQSSNKDLIFEESSSVSNSALDSAVKGVKEFAFNRVFDPMADQNDLYQEVAYPLVEGLFPKEAEKTMIGDKVVGESALLFSYGITNAGKTHTIMGNKSNATSLHESHGIIPRSIDHILTKIKQLEKLPTRRVNYSFCLSYLEIYNEQIFDLLPKKKSSGVDIGLENSLKLREGRNGRIYVKGLTKHSVTSLAEGLKLCQDAKKKRHTSSNNINSDSSRSHSICQFELIATPIEYTEQHENESVATGTSGYGTDDDSVLTNAGKKSAVTLWVVDLAGSERSKRTGNFSRSMRQKEAALINSSLMKLMRCLQTLRDNQNSSSVANVVPFRESKLTHLFMGHLTGSSASRTSMIVNINPAAADFDETQHVLAYATVAKSVRIDKTEFCKMRRKIQGNKAESVFHTHDINGRRVAKDESPPRKLAKIVKKLSPRAALARRRENREAEAKKNKDLGPNAGQNKLSVTGTKRKLEDENSKLNAALEAALHESHRLANEAQTLSKKMETCESAIRKELAQEMEEQIRFTQIQHEEIVRRLKQQIHASQIASQSAKKARRDKAEEIIEQYMDKVDECEEEIDRLKAEHEEKIASLELEFRSELNKKDKVISDLKMKLQENELEISRLRNEVDISDSVSLHDDDQSLESETYEDSPISSSSTPSSDQEISVKPHETPSSANATPRTRRLPRKRCSEVACTNVSPMKEEPVSSSKKRGLKLATSKFNALQKLASPPSKRTIKEEDIIFPSSQPEFDEDRKLYIRPRKCCIHLYSFPLFVFSFPFA